MNDFIVIVPIVLSLFATAFSLIQWYSGRGQRDATEADTLTGAALKTVKLMQGSIDDLEKASMAHKKEIDELIIENASLKASVRQLTRELKAYHDGTQVLIAQLIEAQIKPQWLPPEVKE